MANIDKELEQIKNAVYGKDVRGSIHDGIEKINKESEISSALSDEIGQKQASLEQQFIDQILNMTLKDPSSAEIVSARTAKDGTTYTTLKERLDNLIVLSKTEPNADFWLEDVGEAPITFDPTSIMIANAELNNQAPENTENFWFKS